MMKVFKRIISGLLVVSLLLSACGSGNQGETESYISKSEEGKIMQLVNFIGDTILSNEDGENAPDIDLLPLNLYSGNFLETRKDFVLTLVNLPRFIFRKMDQLRLLSERL